MTPFIPHAPHNTIVASFFTSTMYLQTLLCLLSMLLRIEAKPTASIIVIGSAFCDSCSEGSYSKRSYFLEGARVLIQCKLGTTSVTANQTTDRYGVYHLSIPSVSGFKCRPGREMKSMCQAVLIESSSSSCGLNGIPRSTSHVAVKPRTTNLCIFNMNALSSRPPAGDAGFCGGHSRPQSSSLDSSLCFWPLFPPFGLPWLHWPPLPFTLPPLPFPFNSIPLPDPSSLPFSLPPWLLPFLNPASLPFPFSLFPPLTTTTPFYATPPPDPLSPTQP